MGLETDIRNIARLNKELSSLQNSLNQQMNALVKKIKGGQTTGDRIRDFVIVYYDISHGIEGEAERAYRQLEGRIKGKEGQQILIVENQEDDAFKYLHCGNESMRGMFPPHDRKIIHSDYSLGILAGGLELDVKEGHVIFPAEKHAVKSEKGREDWSLKDGPIKMHHVPYFVPDSMDNLFKEIDPVSPRILRREQKGLSIYLGKDAEKYFRQDVFLRKSYVQALNLLGWEAPADMKEEYKASQHDLKEDIANKLASINLVDPEKHGSKIKDCLSNAVELGMHREDFKWNTPLGNAKITAERILALCRKFNINIPK